MASSSCWCWSASLGKCRACIPTWTWQWRWWIAALTLSSTPPSIASSRRASDACCVYRLLSRMFRLSPWRERHRSLVASLDVHRTLIDRSSLLYFSSKLRDLFTSLIFGQSPQFSLLLKNIRILCLKFLSTLHARSIFPEKKSSPYIEEIFCYSLPKLPTAGDLLNFDTLASHNELICKPSIFTLAPNQAKVLHAFFTIFFLEVAVNPYTGNGRGVKWPSGRFLPEIL